MEKKNIRIVKNLFKSQFLRHAFWWLPIYKNVIFYFFERKRKKGSFDV